MIATLLAIALLAEPSAGSKLPGAASSEPVLLEETALDDAPPDEAEPAQSEPAAPAPKPAPVMTRTTPRRAPRPIRWRLDPFLDVGTMRVGDRGYRAFGDGPGLFQLGTGVRIDARVRGPFFLGGGIRYVFARSSGYPYGDGLSTELTLHEPRLLVRASVVLLEGLDVIAQLEGGASFARATFDSYDYDASSYASSSYGNARKVLGVFEAKGGLSLYLPKQWLAARGATRVTAGIDLMLGYGLRTGFAVRPRPEGDSGGIPVRGADLGNVAVRGLVWSIGLFVRIM